MPQTIADIEQIIDGHWKLLNRWFEHSNPEAVIEFADIINNGDLGRFVQMILDFPDRAQMVKNFAQITLCEKVLRTRLKLASE